MIEGNGSCAGGLFWRKKALLSKVMVHVTLHGPITLRR